MADSSASPEAPPDGADLQARLQALAGRIAEGGGEVTQLRRLSGGASQETWAFNLDGAGETQRFILRRAPKNVRVHENSAGLENEAALMRLAAEADVPSPPVKLVLAPEDGIGRGFIMEHVDGETIARKILRDKPFDAVRPTLARRCGELLAGIHSVPRDRLPPLRLADAATQLHWVEARYRSSRWGRPTIELALVWLKDHMPAPREPTLVHGDFRNGNLIISPEGVQAVLDWEIAHIGDPMEDLGWVCVGPWRFNELDKPVGGFGSREEMFAGYEAASGTKVDPQAVRFWEVLGSASWCVSCGLMGVDDLKQRDRPLERAMIGRRASENEVDLLRLLTEEA